MSLSRAHVDQRSLLGAFRNSIKTQLDGYERQIASSNDVSLTYGALTERTIDNLIELLELRNAKVVFDLGFGFGGTLAQLYLKCTGIQTLIGVEFSRSRFNRAATIYNELIPSLSANTLSQEEIGFLDVNGEGEIILRCGDGFNPSMQEGIDEADFVLLMVCKNTQKVDFQRIFERIKLGCYILCYHDLTQHQIGLGIQKIQLGVRLQYDSTLYIKVAS